MSEPGAAEPSVSQNSNEEPLSSSSTLMLGSWHVVLGLVLLISIYHAWPPDYDVVREQVVAMRDHQVAAPASVSAAPAPEPPAHSTSSGVSSPGAGRARKDNVPTDARDAEMRLQYDRRLLLSVLLIGALGSYLHAIGSFADFVGNQRLTRNWVWWYLLRPLTGAPLALIFYCALRAGFLNAGGSAEDVNRFGVATLAGLVGMFSMKATDKLREIFDVLFKTTPQRRDPLANPVPMLTGAKADPALTKTTARSAVTLKGNGFVTKSRVLVNGEFRAAEFRSATELAIVIEKADLKKAATLKIAVVNPEPGGGKSGELEMPIE